MSDLEDFEDADDRVEPRLSDILEATRTIGEKMRKEVETSKADDVVASSALKATLDEVMQSEVVRKMKKDDDVNRVRENLSQSAKKLKKMDGSLKEGKELLDELKQSNETKELMRTGERLLTAFENSDSGKKALGFLGKVIDDHGEDAVRATGKIVSSAIDTSKTSAKQVEGLSQKLARAKMDANTENIVAGGIRQTAAVTDRLARELDENAVAKVDTTLRKNITWLKEQKIGNQAIAGVTHILADVEKRGIDSTIASAKDILTNGERRKEFFASIKDAALNYLMEYLPTVRVPKIEGEHMAVNYSLENIKLKRFKLTSDDVSILIVGSTVHLRIDNLEFDCEAIKWTYQQQGFPYLYGEGLADCVSKRAKMICVFRLGIVDKVSTVLSSEKQKKKKTTTEAVSTKSDVDDELIDAERTKEVIRRLKQETAAGGGDGDDDNGEDANEKLLTMDKPFIKLAHLELSIRGNRMAFVYNTLITYFQTYVSGAIESALVDALVKNSSTLLEKMNDLGSEYWPVLLDVASKNVDTLNDAARRSRKYTASIVEAAEASEELKTIRKEVVDAREAGREILLASTTEEDRKRAREAVRALGANAKEISKDALHVNVKFASTAPIDPITSDAKDSELVVRAVACETAATRKRPKRYVADFVDGPIGFGIACERGVTVVKRLNVDKLGRPQQAQALGVLPGDVITKMAGKDIGGLRMRDIAKIIRGSPRPLSIEFRTDFANAMKD